MSDFEILTKGMEVIADLEILTKGMKEQEGALTLHYSKSSGWGGALTFGEEAEDSPMAGGAAYSLGPTIAIVLSDIVSETGWRP